MTKYSWFLVLASTWGCSGSSGEARLDIPAPPPDLSGVPPVSGGTLLVLKDQKTAIVADPDHGQVVVVDLAERSVRHVVALPGGSEPGRAAEDALGQVHVVLRGSGKLLSIDPQSGSIIGTRSVCSNPRGLAVADDVIHVACAEGRLVSLSSDVSVTEPLRDLALDRDLRDVVVAPDGLWISRFRSAQVLRLDSEGKLVKRITLPDSTARIEGELNVPVTRLSVASVAWRMIGNPAGGVIVVHQSALLDEVPVTPGGYGSGPGSGHVGQIVGSEVSTIDEQGVVLSSSVALNATLPVDIAQAPDGGSVLLASAAVQDAAFPGSLSGPRSLSLKLADLRLSAAPEMGEFLGGDASVDVATEGAPVVAVAFAAGSPVLQLHGPNRLLVAGESIPLPGGSELGLGSELFHLQTGSGLACASCHPEGQEDGHVWTFAGFGKRRTQSLRGGVLETAPFHWDGSETDMTMLTADVMRGRMSGPELAQGQVNALGAYLSHFQALRAPSAETTAVEHGRVLFQDPQVGCASCHSGKHFTNNKTVPIGVYGAELQVPTLVGLWARAPYLHDGCANTILERFTRCDPGNHGNIAGLTPTDLEDLSQYLETL